MRIQKVITVDSRNTESGISTALVGKMEQAFRVEWAEKIREEFGKYHEHSTDGGECGACGAIQAANWMDPGVQK
jgi:hypothetical protein